MIAISQVKEFQLLFHDIHVKGMILSEFLQVNTILQKLSPS